VVERHSDFTHLMLTRFNTAIGYAPNSKGLDEEWLRGRVALFEQYCLPSVEAQRDVPFDWLIFCDARSPGWFRDKLLSYGPILKPVYIDGPATDDVIARRVKETISIKTPYLVTTRLDNDDAIGDRHLPLIQNAFSHQDREFLVFPFGLQSFRGQLYNVYWPSNPFLSLIEKVRDDGSFTTVLCIAHDKMRLSNQVRDIHTAPQWLQVIHGGNLLNSLRGWPRLSSGQPSQFHVHWPREVQDSSLLSRIEVSGTAFLARGRRLTEKVRAKLRNA